MPPTDLAELRRLHEAAMQEASTPQDLRKSMNAAYLALPALLDELEAAREEVFELKADYQRLEEIRRDLMERCERMRSLDGLPLDEIAARQITRDRRMKLIGAAEELKRSAKTLREDLADMNQPEFASRGKVSPGYCECLQDVADHMEERAAQLRREAGEK